MLRSFALVLLLAGCASAPRVILQPTTSRASPRAQDLRFARVDVDRLPILTALEAICAEIDKFTAQVVAGISHGPIPLAPSQEHPNDLSRCTLAMCRFAKS